MTDAVKVCVEDPRFCTRICSSPEKSRENSATPKLTLPASLVPRATTEVRVAANGWTSPEPPSFGWKPPSCDASAVLAIARSEEHTSELQSLAYLVCRLLLEKKKKKSK